MQDSGLSLRPVTESDRQQVWEWANDPAVRAVSFSQSSIPWDSHVEWFAQKLHDPNCYWFVACDRHNNPIGQVRFEIVQAQTAEIHLSLDQAKRGLGYGTLLINLAVQKLFQTTSIQSIHAFIKPGNQASIRAFEQAHFDNLGTAILKDQIALHYTRSNFDR
jgi:UDP-2,4-diacetamido-2,4,6-trideoxy-beta-L-altropyranose hydrolase